MPSRRSLLPGLLAVLAACGDGGTETPRVDRVTVTPGEVAVSAIGETAQFTAQALTTAGAPLSDAEFTWSSSNPSVATVDASGRATAVSVGEAFIQAESDGVVGDGRLVVRECGEALQLEVGESSIVDVPGQDACGFILPAGSSGDRYRVAIVRTNSNDEETDVATVSLRVRTLGAGPAPVAPEPVVTPPTSPRRAPLRIDALGLQDAVRIAERTREHHEALRESEVRMLEHLGHPRPLPTRRVGAARIQRQATPDRIMIDPATPTFCSPAGTRRPAFKIAENADMVVYQDSVQQLSLPVSADQAQRTIDYYSQHGKPIIEQYFGGVTDIDGNGKIAVVAHPTVSSGVAAFVWSGDLLPQSECAASNEMELIFFSASLFRALDDAQNASYQAFETIVHEAKHVSSLYHSIVRGSILGRSAFHPGWIEEGVAEIAGNMSSRTAWETVGGPAPNVMLDEALIRDLSSDGAGDVHPEFFGVLIRLFRVQGYLSVQPNSVVTNPTGAPSSHSIYGSGWAFWRWVADAYADAASAPLADAGFFLAQNDSLATEGVGGLVELTGRSYADLMTEYARAVMLNGTEAPAPARAYTTYDLVSSIEVFCFAADNPPCDGLSPGPDGSYPWPVTTQSNGTMFRGFVNGTYQGQAGPSGLRIHELRSSGQQDIEVLTSGPAATRIVIVRIE